MTQLHISKPRNMWLLRRRPRLVIKSSCQLLSNPQNTNLTPAACSTPPPAARRPPPLKVSYKHTRTHALNKHSSRCDAALNSPVTICFLLWKSLVFYRGSFNAISVRTDGNLLLTCSLILFSWCVYVCVCLRKQDYEVHQRWKNSAQFMLNEGHELKLKELFHILVTVHLSS